MAIVGHLSSSLVGCDYFLLIGVLVKENEISVFDDKCETKTKEIKISSPRWDSFLLHVTPFAKNTKMNSSDPRSGLAGLEPAASALTGRCFDRLNYISTNSS